MKPTAAQIEAQLGAVYEAYYNAVLKQAAEIREAVLIPFCNKKKYKFFAGNGDFYFDIQNGAQIWSYDKATGEMAKLLKLLNIEIQGMPCDSLGTLMENYDGTQERTR